MVSKTDLPVLDRWRADEILEPERPIWGLPTIAKVLGVSVDMARRWAKEPAVPITQPEGSGSYFAYKSELVSWLRQKKTNGCP